MKRLPVKPKFKMSDNVPFEIQEEIMKRLPLKSLLQFRSVSRPWKSLIDSSRFIKHYSGSKRQHLLLSYEDAINHERKYVSIADDNTFPHKKVSLAVPHSLNKIDDLRLIGSSHGLLCLYEDCPFSDDKVYKVSISKLRESLVVLEHDDDEMAFVVWMMEDGVSKAFTKLFTVNINTPDALRFVWGFRKTGEAIIEDHHRQLVVYEPYSKQINHLGVDGNHSELFVHSYMETLLLHDQPNLKIYKDPQVHDDLFL